MNGGEKYKTLYKKRLPVQPKLPSSSLERLCTAVHNHLHLIELRGLLIKLGMRKSIYCHTNAGIHKVLGDEILWKYLHSIWKASPEDFSEKEPGVTAYAVCNRKHAHNRTAMLWRGCVLHTVEVRPHRIRFLFRQIVQVREKLRKGKVCVDPVILKIRLAP